MDFIGFAIKRPTAVAAAVLIVLALGLVALQTIPIQLTPDVRRPVLQVTTSWSGASPLEVEREITNRLEEELAGVEGVVEMSSDSDLGRSRITLEFNVGQNMDRAFMLVSNRLGNVSDLPAEAGEPAIRTSGSEDVPIARLAMTRLEGNTRGIDTYGDLVEDVIADRLQRVAGVSQVDYAGGSARELQVIIEPSVLAGYGLTVPRVLQALREANVTLTAGAVEEGKRRYIVRTDSETATVEKLRSVVLQTTYDSDSGPSGGGRLADVTVGDIAQVRLDYEDPTSNRRFNGQPMIRLNVVREGGANVIETMEGLREAVRELNEGPLRFEAVELVLFYDETVYINSAIKLVEQNIFVGGALAALILILFLRSWRATAVVVVSIPISVIATFVAMALVGRSLNVISLAGIAFAVGMVVDAAIVVLENIFRLRQGGAPSAAAAREGARQVWGAILASALTTVMVFIPILLLELPAGQLFRDIAVAISVSVLLSLLVAVTVIPTLSNKMLGSRKTKGGAQNDFAGRFHLPVIDPLAGLFVRGVLGVIRRVISSRVAALGVVAVICGGAALSTYLFMPRLDYLPDGNRNFVFSRVQPPPGYNLATTYELAERIEAATRPYWVSEAKGAAKEDDPPHIQNFFFVALRNIMFVGASATEIDRAGELVPILKKAVSADPGTRGFVSQSSIFGRSIGGSRTIYLNVTGPDIEQIIAVAGRADELVEKAFADTRGLQVRIDPGLELGAPEIRVTPDLRRLAKAKLTARDLAISIDTMNDGTRVAEVNLGSRRIDVTLMGPEGLVTNTQGINALPIVTGTGLVLPADSLADIELTSGPTEILHVDRERAITVIVTPPKSMPLQDAIEVVREKVVAPLEAGALGGGMKLSLSGAADDLSETWGALQLNLVVALIIVYLVISVLYESLVYPLIIMLSVPLATAGGLLGLAALNTYVAQPLDMLTMLGFVILIGIVVNNAILLVDQALQNSRSGMPSSEAILQATRNRIRPIFMSTLTSIFGLLPLAVFPGAGSELYRGLGSVVIGGLSLSALLTLAIIPPLLSLLLPKDGAKGAAGKSEQPFQLAAQ
ncbi:efflux RND transporter permease subunit [Pelagibius marinus]|uniref:efflux RND transporter permease subunit n=1 Tax=Pelagibius marinus TaxID=2762760 RepID=UPI001872BAEE|nr:efflux RND transporter permease subunit [Pelagibius marinus]